MVYENKMKDIFGGVRVQSEVSIFSEHFIIDSNLCSQFAILDDPALLNHGL